MKKIITAIAILMVTFINAQTKEGYVLYTTTLEGMPPEQAAMMGDMETKVYFKGGKSLTEVNSMMYSMKSLNDDNGVLMIQETMGNKSFVKMSKADLEKKAAAEAKEKKKDPKIEYANETKTVAGYECKKAIVTVTTKDSEVKTDVWYTEKVPYISGGGGRKGGEMFPGLKGMPLEYSFAQGPYKMKMSAKEISLAAVPDSKFSISTEGYTEMKADDLKKQQGGGSK